MQQQHSRTGKGKAVEERRNGQGGVSQIQPSMATRVAYSASCLARDMVSSSSANDLNATLASGLGSKAQQSLLSAGSSTWSDALPSRPGGTSSNGLTTRSTLTNGGENFRTSSSAIYDAEFSDDFFHDNHALSLPSTVSAYDEIRWTGEFHSPHPSHQPPTQTQVWQDTHNLDLSYGGAVQYEDGADVRWLLSNPGVSVDFDPSDTVMGDLSDEKVADLFNSNLSPGEQQAADRLRSSLPAPPVHRQAAARHPLNLIPDSSALGTCESTTHHPMIEQGVRLRNGEQDTMFFASQAQREQWLSEWDGVLNGYSDEVWGEMLPAVRVARTQLQEVQAGVETLDSKAVTRLKMILGHVVQQAYPQMEQPTSAPQNVAHDGEADREIRRPTFHCPWISCHQRFNNIMELQLHSSTHRPFTCPHDHCAANFSQEQEWSEHIMIAHHDVLDTRVEPWTEVKA